MGNDPITWPKITQEEMKEFKKITKKVYDRELTDNEAYDQGGRMVMLFELILKYKK